AALTSLSVGVAVPYASPETLSPEDWRWCRAALDVWSLGVMLIELATGRLFHWNPSTDPLPRFECDGEGLDDTLAATPPTDPFVISLLLLGKQCTDVEAARRPSVDEALLHPFFSFGEHLPLQLPQSCCPSERKLQAVQAHLARLRGGLEEGHPRLPAQVLAVRSGSTVLEDVLQVFGDMELPIARVFQVAMGEPGPQGQRNLVPLAAVLETFFQRVREPAAGLFQCHTCAPAPQSQPLYSRFFPPTLLLARLSPPLDITSASSSAQRQQGEKRHSAPVGMNPLARGEPDVTHRGRPRLAHSCDAPEMWVVHSAGLGWPGPPTDRMDRGGCGGGSPPVHAEDVMPVLPLEDSACTLEKLGQYKAVGRVLAKCVLEGIHVAMPLCPSAHLFLLDREELSEDVNELIRITALYNPLRASAVQAVFAVTHMDGRQHHVPAASILTTGLAGDGERVTPGSAVVTDRNKADLVTRSLRHELVQAQRRALEMIRDGFWELPLRQHLPFLNADELAALLCGHAYAPRGRISDLFVLEPMEWGAEVAVMDEWFRDVVAELSEPLAWILLLRATGSTDIGPFSRDRRVIVQRHSRRAVIFQPRTLHMKVPWCSGQEELAGRLTQALRSGGQPCMHFCCVCWAPAPGNAGVLCSGAAKHFVCDECFTRHVRIESQADVDVLRARGSRVHCPLHTEGCYDSEPFSDSLIAQHVEEGAYMAYMRALRKLIEAELVEASQPQLNDDHIDPHRRQHAAEQEEIERLQKQIVAQIIGLKCPRCAAEFAGYAGEDAVQCTTCGAGFCPLCLTDCNSDARHHAEYECELHAPLEDGGGPALQSRAWTHFNHIHRERRQREVTTFMDALQLTEGMRTRVLSAAEEDLVGLGVDVSALHHPLGPLGLLG
ncbi:hypothetical protein CYMTET_20300, partial [Cymbomonas tetramitiformis]